MGERNLNNIYTCPHIIQLFWRVAFKTMYYKKEERRMEKWIYANKTKQNESMKILV